MRYKIIDQKFIQHGIGYIVQCLMVTLVVFIILLTLNSIKTATIVAALGASAFIAFGMPHRQVSRARYLLGGYAIGIVVGGLCHYLSVFFKTCEFSPVASNSHALSGAIAVGASIFVMSVIDMEHPPAAGLALGFVIGDVNLKTILVVVIGISLITIFKTILKPFFRDLL